MNNIARRIILDNRMRDGYSRSGDRRRYMEGNRRGDPYYDSRSMDYNDYDPEDMRRRNRDRGYGDWDEDYGEPLRLSKRDITEWKRELENADGTIGEHFDLPTIRQVAQAFNLPMRDYDEKELCMAVNMLYSDFCEVLKQFIPRDKEAMAYVKFAQAFLEDPDAGVKGGEKLAVYYHTIVCDE